MKDTVRFGEYTLFGGILWLFVACFTTIISLINTPETTVSISATIALWMEWIQPIINESTHTAIKSLGTAIFVVVLFLTGLLLDILSEYYFAPYEALHFRHWILKDHRSWLDTLVDRYPEFIEKEYKQFLEQPFLSWKEPKNWFKRAIEWQKQRYRYKKLRLFLISYIMTHANSSTHTEMMNQLNLWRTGRAISMSMLFFCTMLFYAVNAIEATTLLIFIISIIIPGILFYASVVLSKELFSKMCIHLFAVTYAIDKEKSS
jgi:hypothetical protein